MGEHTTLPVVVALRGIRGCHGLAQTQEIGRRAAALIEQQHAALKAVDDIWTQEFPKGPDEPQYRQGIVRLADETWVIWRQIRAALAAATTPEDTAT